MAPKTRFGGSSASKRGQASSSSSKRAREDPTPPRQRATRGATSSTISSEDTTPIPTLPWPFKNAAQRKVYEKLVKRGLVCTRFIDDSALDHLGLSEEVYGLMDGIGWGKFGRSKFSTFRELTLEFLSSFEMNVQPYVPEDAGKISFRLMGVERTHTLATFNSIFGFPLEGVRAIEETNFSAENTWVAFTETDLMSNYDARMSKSTNLKNPALRIIHRFLAHSIFGRGESTGVVRRDELFFLWAMTQQITLNVGMWICLHLFQHKGGTGKICIGGLVSIIADFYGIEFIPNLHTRVVGQDRIDLDMLTMMRICKKESGEYFLLNEAGEIIPKRTTVIPVSPIASRPSTSFGGEASTPPRATATVSASMATATAQGPTQETNQATLEMIISRLERMDTRLERMDRRLERMDTRMERMDTHLDSRFDRVDSRLDDLEGKFDDPDLE